MGRDFRRRIRGATVALAACLSLSLPAFGDRLGGCIPRWQSGQSFTASGCYFLTQDVVGNSPVFFVTPGVGDITLDLNGHTLTAVGPGPVVQALGTTAGSSTLTITNGTLKGDPTSNPLGIVFQSDAITEVILLNLIANGILELNEPGVFTVRNTKAGGLRVTGNSALPATGSVRDATFVDSAGDGVNVTNGSAVQISHTVVEKPTGAGVVLNNCDGCQAENVTVQEAGGNGVEIANSTGVQVKDTNVYNATTSALDIDATVFGATVAYFQGALSATGVNNRGHWTLLTGSTFFYNVTGIDNSGNDMTLDTVVSGGNGNDFNECGTGTMVAGISRVSCTPGNCTCAP